MNSPESSRRAGTTSPLRRAAQYALSLGIVLAVVSAFGSVWIVRVGLAALAVAAVLAVRFAWREIREQRETHLKAMADSAQAQTESVAIERRRTGEVLEAMSGHNQRADARVRELEGDITGLRDELDTLRIANAGLTADLIERDHRIARVTADLKAREAELKELREADGHAEVLAMPRHGTSWESLPSAEELFDEEHPMVIDLQQLAFPAEEAEVRKQA